MGIVRTVLVIANKRQLPICQMDVKTAFLYGEIDEDIFVEIPKGFGKEEDMKETHVMKLQKAVYGLQISPKKWYERFERVMQKLGVRADPAEPCLYIWREKEEFVLLILYVDDILITGTNSEMIGRIQNTLKENFVIKDLGEPAKYLGISISRDIEKKVMTLTQKEYIMEILRKFELGKKKKAPTPMTESELEISEEIIEKYQELNFKEVTGSLQYLAGGTRPDIAYVTNWLSRCQDNPQLAD